MSGVSSEELFDRRLQRCPLYIREMFTSLDAYLVRLQDVTTRIDRKAEGRTYCRSGKWFARMDPKFSSAWIGVRIYGVEPAMIETVAKVRKRIERHWIHLTDPGKVDDLKQVLRRAYELRGLHAEQR